MNFRQPPSKFKNQILTAQKRDQFHSELDLTKDAIGNDATRTVQANHDTLVFSCGHSGVGLVPLAQPGKFGFAHVKISCGHVSDIHIHPFVQERLLAVSCTDQSVRVYRIPDVAREEDVAAPDCEVRASAGTANTPVLLTWNPQVSGVLAIGSGTKVDLLLISSGKIERTVDVRSPILTMDWSHDGGSVLVVSRDATLRVVDVREGKIAHEVKLTGTKQVVKSLPNGQWVVSSLSRMRERELNLYASSELGKSLKTWNFGTASTPLIPIPDTVRKIVYLLDKSGGTLRWIEMFAPYNEGAAGTSVEQSSNACLIHPFGLQIMEGEINRVMIADVKGNMVPVKVTIGRKSYNEFHEDLFTPIEVESSISGAEWLDGQDEMAKMAKVDPSLLSAAAKGDSLSKYATTQSSSTVKGSTTVTPEQAKPVIDTAETDVENAIVSKLQETSISSPRKDLQAQSAPKSVLSAREQRKWDREESKVKESTKPSNGAREVFREDLSSRRAEYGAPSKTAEKEEDNAAKTRASEESKANFEANATADEPSKTAVESKTVDGDDSLSKRRAPVLDDEDALERLRSRRVTPALEAQEQQMKLEAPQPTREVFREDLSARRAEYGASSSTGGREVFRENLGERRAEYGAGRVSRVESPMRVSEKAVSPEPVPQSSGGREVYREDRSARRAEYGAPSKLGGNTSSTISKAASPSLSAREQRKWDKEEAESKPASPALKAQPEIYREDRSARRAEYGATTTTTTTTTPPPSKPSRVSTAEREVFKEDLSARRAEYGAVTPRLAEPTTAFVEMKKALGSKEPAAEPTTAEETVPYPEDDDLDKVEKVDSHDSTAELENVYAPPIEDTKVNEKKPDIPVDEPAAIVDKSTSSDSVKVNEKAPSSEPIKTQIGRASTAPASTTAAKDVNQSSSTHSEYRQYTRKYLQGKPQHPRNSYTSLVGLNASLPNTARMIHTTPKHIAIPLAGPGGRIAIIPSERSGRLPPLLSGFTGGAQVVDFELDRFNLKRLVSAHVDNCVKVWTIPSNLDELESDLDTPDHILKGMDRILALSFHPSAKGLMMVTTATKIHLFDIEAGEELKVIPARGVANSCWSLDGSQIALGKSDKSIAILDARSGNELQSFASAHSSTRPFRIQYVGKDRLITAGFGRGSTRELALYDLNKGKDIQVHEMDISPSPFALPHFEEMSSILYLIPRGSSNILPFHIMRDTIVPLTAYTAADPIMGTAFFAPQDLSIREVEIARCVRLSTNEITVVGFHIPRPAGDVFHDDIYPVEVRNAYHSSLSAKDWMKGAAPEAQKIVNLNPEGLKGASASGIGSIGKKANGTPVKSVSRIQEAEVKKPSELEQMFNKAKGQEGDEPENMNRNKNTEWD